MSRQLAAPADAALESASLPLLMFVEVHTDPVLRLCNADRAVAWNGFYWLGAGALGRVGTIEEGATQQMYGITLQLTGIAPENIATALGSDYRGRACRVWLAPLGADHRPLADPLLVFGGRLDTMEIELGATATLTVIAESRLTDWHRARASRYTHEEQQALHPGDMGLQYVAAVAEMDLVWGRA